MPGRDIHWRGEEIANNSHFNGFCHQSAIFLMQIHRASSHPLGHWRLLGFKDPSAPRLQSEAAERTLRWLVFNRWKK